MLDDKREASPSYPVGQPGETVASLQHLIRRPSANRAAGRSREAATAVALVDRIKDQQHPSKMSGLPCSIGVLLDQLEGDEKAALLAMLGTPEQRGWSQHQIYDALTSEGYTVGRQSINRHRAGHCRCGKDAS